MKSFLVIGAVAVGLFVPLSLVAQDQRPEGDRDRNQGYGDSQNRWQGRLSAEDQARFNSYYSRWLSYRQNNDRDQIGSMEGRMRDDVTQQHSRRSAIRTDRLERKPATRRIAGPTGTVMITSAAEMTVGRNGKTACPAGTRLASTVTTHGGWMRGAPAIGTRLAAWKSGCGA
jgi:hypothetical protein